MGESVVVCSSIGGGVDINDSVVGGHGEVVYILVLDSGDGGGGVGNRV